MGSVAVLNRSDVDRLLKQPSPHVRAIVAQKLSAVMENPGVSERELLIAKDIIREMAVDVEVVVRIAVARNLRHSRHLPHDAAVRLACDVEAVALPILTDSEILTDSDLIELVKAGSAVKQKAIAGRPHVSEDLSDAIVTTADETAVGTLMGNRGAEIAERSFGKAMDRFTASNLVKERMVMREKLPAAVVERLAVMVSEKLQQHLIAHHDVPPAVAAEITRRGMEMAVVSMNRHISSEEMEQLVSEMHRKGRLTPSIVLRGLCAGNLTFFEFAVAALANISVSNASTLVHDPGDLALESLCRKATIPANFVPVLRIALWARDGLAPDGSESGLRDYRRRIIERILTQAPDMDEKDVEFFLDLINDKSAHH